MALPLSTIGMLFTGTARNGIDLSFLTRSSASGGAAADIGTVKTALANAEKNEAKQIAQVAKDPQIQKDIARYIRVVKSAKTIDDVLADPVARTVLMTAAGLKSQIDNIGLAKKAMSSDPTDRTSVAVRMSSVNGAWLKFAQDFNIAQYGVDRLHPKQNGFEARWRVTLEREGEAIEAELEIKKVRGAWQAQVDGVGVPIIVDGDSITLDLLWRDAEDELHTSRLTGILGKDGLSGAQLDDGVELETPWTASLYFADAVKEVSDNYIAEKRLDMLDQQMPGLGSAVLFKDIAKNLKNATDILGSPLGREVITTAFNIPKQIAIQSMVAQEKAINQRLNPAKLQDAHFADQIAQRYLIMLNGGLGGITV